MSMRMVPRRSPASIRGIRWTRHALQTSVVAFIAYTVWAKATGGPGAPSGEAFCPFGGFETLFTWVTTGRTVSHVHTANLVLAGAVVLLTLAARGAFCGWLCPFGAIQEAIHGVGDAVTNRIPPLRRARRRISANATWLARVDHVARHGRYVVLVWAVVGAAVTGVMVFREYDPWSALLSVVEFEVTTAFVILVVMLAMALVVERPFCRYACPLGAVIGHRRQGEPRRRPARRLHVVLRGEGLRRVDVDDLHALTDRLDVADVQALAGLGGPVPAVGVGVPRHVGGRDAQVGPLRRGEHGLHRFEPPRR